MQSSGNGENEVRERKRRLTDAGLVALGIRRLGELLEEDEDRLEAKKKVSKEHVRLLLLRPSGSFPLYRGIVNGRALDALCEGFRGGSCANIFVLRPLQLDHFDTGNCRWNRRVFDLEWC